MRWPGPRQSQWKWRRWQVGGHQGGDIHRLGKREANIRLLVREHRWAVVLLRKEGRVLAEVCSVKTAG